MNIIPYLTTAEKRKLRIWIHCETDAGMRTRMTLILHLAKGKPAMEVAEALNIARSTVYRVAQRFRVWGWQGLADRREDNGPVGVDELFLLHLRQAVAASPRDYGFARPTWTQELLCQALAERTGLRVSQATMSRLLQRIGARRGRPRPVLRCPWPKARQKQRLRRIRRLVASIPAKEVAVYADEVDIHLNPKIGYDWQLRGQQKRVLTPGQNAKRYLAGALDVRSGRLRWVTATHKRSGLFIELLRHLARALPQARVIHVIVDNYSIHSSRQTRLALAAMPRVKLHFLPPYSPTFNPIERVWLDLHAEVTRNHHCQTMEELLAQVRHYLRHRNRTTLRNLNKAVA
jgi:transposase